MRVEFAAQGALNVTPSDTDNLAFPSGTHRTRGLYVAVTGDLAVEMVDGSTVTFTDIAAGVFHSIAVTKVLSTGTTATGIVALY